MKSRKHTFTITVTFDKACSASHALREVKDTIHGEFYPTQRSDDEPGLYRVGGFAKLPSAWGRALFIARRLAIEPGDAAFWDRHIVSFGKAAARG